MKQLRGLLVFLPVLLIAIALSANGVNADIAFKDLGNTLDTASLGIDLHMLYRFDNNPYFGAPVGSSNDKNTGFGEILSKIRFTAGKNFKWAALEAQVAPYYVSTIDKDLYGIYSDVSEVGFDQAWMKFKNLFGYPVDLTIGRQDIQIEK